MENVPDVFSDGLGVNVSPFGLVLKFTMSNPEKGTEAPKPVVYIRTSLEHAKVASILLKKVLKQHEDTQGSPIVLHPQLYQNLGISKQEDW